MDARIDRIVGHLSDATAELEALRVSWHRDQPMSQAIEAALHLCDRATRAVDVVRVFQVTEIDGFGGES